MQLKTKIISFHTADSKPVKEEVNCTVIPTPLVFFGLNIFRAFVGVVSQPSTFSSLELGYAYTPQGQCLPVEEVDLPLWQHGEGGDHPKDFGFRFKAGGEWHEVQVVKLLLLLRRYF